MDRTPRPFMCFNSQFSCTSGVALESAMSRSIHFHKSDQQCCILQTEETGIFA